MYQFPDPAFAFSCYPDARQVDSWADSLLQRSQVLSLKAEFSDFVPITESFGNNPNTLEGRYVSFTLSSGHRFWGYWQPAMKQPAPLLINLPGYGSCISCHPQINDDGYHILHISPLGYVEPQQIHGELRRQDGSWPVLENTALGLPGGYEDWLLDCLLAIRWARAMPQVLADRVSLFGTSQGGGGSLLLASLLGEDIRCVCADLPFLTGFPLSHLEGPAYGILQQACSLTPPQLFWNRLGYVDTLSHAHRIRVPVMLSAGGRDTVCPPCTVKALFEKLPEVSKQYTYLKDNVHTHSRQSMFLFRNWLSLYG